jgi:hypothetical protein
MGTRSSIALEYADGTIKQIYAHWDGYIDGNGHILFNHYNTPEAANELISMGDLSSLDETIETTVFYARDRGEDGVDARSFSDFKEYERDGDFESYNYIMREGIWYVDRGGNNSFTLLEEAFREEEE